jgi:potassium inwardly-rectifying channel subfamily J
MMNLLIDVQHAGGDNKGTLERIWRALRNVKQGQSSRTPPGVNCKTSPQPLLEEQEARDSSDSVTVDLSQALESMDGNENVKNDFPLSDYKLPRRDTSSTINDYIAAPSTAHSGNDLWKSPFGAIAKRGQLFAKRKRDRLVYKNGAINVLNTNVRKRKRKFLTDIVNTFLDMQWRYVMFLFTAAFCLSWLVFGLVWYLIVIVHKDHLNKDTPDWVPCMDNVYDFTTAFLYSVETQHTIGYGGRAVTAHCSFAIVMLLIQSVFGVVIECIFAGLVFAKLTRPKKRSQTVMFSKNAVICMYDGHYSLVFRVGDMRRSQIIGCTMYAFVVRSVNTDGGDVMPLQTFPMEVNTTSHASVFLAWPSFVAHKIDESSPLWELGEEELFKENFEIVIVMEGTIESSSQSLQVLYNILNF